MFRCIILFLDKDSTALVHNLVFKTCIQILKKNVSESVHAAGLGWCTGFLLLWIIFCFHYALPLIDFLSLSCVLFVCFHHVCGDWNSSVGRVTDLWWEGHRFSTWQKWTENFLLPIQCPYHPVLPGGIYIKKKLKTAILPSAGGRLRLPLTQQSRSKLTIQAVQA